MYYLYILRSEKDNGFYIGVTVDLNRRLIERNKGFSKSTRPRRPLQLVYHEKFNDKSSAYSREYYLKSPKGYIEKIKILDGLEGQRPALGPQS